MIYPTKIARISLAAFFMLLLAFAGQSLLAQTYATSISVLIPGTDGNPTCCGGSPTTNGFVFAKRNPSKALGAPEMSDAAVSSPNYYAMGFGGAVKLTMGSVIYDGPGYDLEIWETTGGFFNKPCAGLSTERVRVLLSQDGIVWGYAGDFCEKGPNAIKVDFGPLFNSIRYIHLTDITPLPISPNNSFDGFDLDGVVGIYSTPTAGRLAVSNEEESLNPTLGKLYPNPVEDFLNIEINGLQDQSVAIRLMDVTGKKVYEGSFNSSEMVANTISIPVKTLQPGMYFIDAIPENQKSLKSVFIRQ